MLPVTFLFLLFCTVASAAPLHDDAALCPCPTEDILFLDPRERLPIMWGTTPHGDCRMGPCNVLVRLLPSVHRYHYIMLSKLDAGTGSIKIEDDVGSYVTLSALESDPLVFRTPFLRLTYEPPGTGEEITTGFAVSITEEPDDEGVTGCVCPLFEDDNLSIEYPRDCPPVDCLWTLPTNAAVEFSIHSHLPSVADGQWLAFVDANNNNSTRWILIGAGRVKFPANATVTLWYHRSARGLFKNRTNSTDFAAGIRLNPTEGVDTTSWARVDSAAAFIDTVMTGPMPEPPKHTTAPVVRNDFSRVVSPPSSSSLLPPLPLVACCLVASVAIAIGARRRRPYTTVPSATV